MNIKPQQTGETSDSELQVQVFKILSHPARVAILEILRDGEHCVCHMEAHLGFRQAYISQQLAVLRDAALIQDRRDGWNIFYRVIKPQIYEVLDAARELTGLPAAGMRQVDIPCTCPTCNPKTGPEDGLLILNSDNTLYQE